ncbi:MAG: Ca-activated chloride channel [Blastocatellia bacterium]|jgi:Ca-activated chloride channel family protein|nr:Ca-activated chloride channel [Blastocatellia bacterium]
MKRNPLLRSTLFAFVCLLAAGAVSHDYSVQAQGSTTEGSLLALNAQGKPEGQCPLKHTDVKTEISGFLARVIVTQQFENPFADKIEAVYTFPLPQAAAVDDMTIVVGDRIVKGKIMRREDAQATYDAARAKGQVAALLSQQRPNIFTQAVANILPGQKINVTISYVETLKYDEGSYEWSFPMVVATRYIPAARSNTDASSADATTPQPATAEATPAEPVSDSEQISPAVMANGRRAGHDISIEMKIDAGVPLVGFHSKTHEIEAFQPGPGKAIVRLKDQATIPNQDFVIRYDVAGSQIADAFLAHRDSRGGFFTFILQPPQRVTVPDVTPKELVFVLDTSGSMSGFPIEKAKETMMLALDGLYPGDTFNVILFSGDTKILFSEPVPATPANINKAKNLLSQAKGDGGTEMMKAIRAALAPSDAQDHVRITCFMTDGQVGDDLEIIAEVQKHPHARVFAMGFGSAPNRFLLDKITEYGRGEVEYVTESGETSGVAKRFHERVRNPLLTDVSIDWAGLPVTDVYPKTIPDLFSAEPVIISGRYAAGGKGVIRLKGRMSGYEFVREIPVELPEQESQHDVLATLWARRKVDHLMSQDMSGMQAGKMRDNLKSEIVSLGLTYSMMTQFTSFVAVEDSVPTDGVEPRRIDVAVESPAGPVSFTGSITETVTVSGGAATLNATSCDISSTVTTRSIQDLPLNGRSVQGLFILAPGSISPGPADANSAPRVNISVNGQRTTSNNFTIDGISGNFGMSPGGKSPGAAASGNTPALTATGGMNPLASLSAAREVTIRTYSNTAEYGRNSGAQVAIVTKSGTNQFHGSAFYFLNRKNFDANDWFANSRGLARPEHGSNEFGGTLGGPIQRDRFFFFASYEGLRLRQPVAALTDVPSLTARRAAPLNTQPLLNLYPLPNRPDRPDGFAEFASSFASSGRHDTASLHLDRAVNSQLMLSAYFNITDSSANDRGNEGYSLNTVNRIFNRAQTFTGTANYAISPKVVAELKGNYSRFTSRSSYLLDTFGGAILPPTSLFAQPALSGDNASFSADLNARGTQLMSGVGVTSTQRQFNVLGSVTTIAGEHTLKFGIDYRRIFPIIGMRQREQSALFDGVTQALTGQAARVNFLTRSQPRRPVFNELSIYGQDEWKVTSKLTLTYGLRWEVSPSPTESNGRDALAVTNVNNPSQLTLAATDARLWATTYGNFGPRVGVAYQPFKNDEFVIRGGVGVLYDFGNGAAGDAFADSYPFLNVQTHSNAPFSFLPASSSSNPITSITAPFSVFDPRLKMPYSLQWSVAAERALGSNQSISLAYVGNVGRHLLLTSTLLDANSDFRFVRLTNNGGSSDYRSLQLQFNRRLSRRLGAMVNYTWAKSVDNFSQDSAAHALFRSTNSETERGPSDFDIRHTLTGFVSYEPAALFSSSIGNVLTRKWSIDSVFNVRSASPVNVVYAVPTSFGFLYLRPDLVAGAPSYLNDAAAGGGRRINPAAFSVPLDLRQGTLGRNTLRGFPLTQFNLALRRRFNFTEEVRLILGAEASNIFNHPNFAAPAGGDASQGTRFEAGSTIHLNPIFGQSFTNGARSAWGSAGSSFGANYYPGGARTMTLSAKLEF